ncbi:Fanconi anemia core complex-associated protein 24-like isoform X2 [Lethenteron reissneri]|uniref:Fanconi anemia core complex-associated protein 24-like isoform X2 n=1 Tax=Lethenteron reissneri TaxID=7753 RepID=UPI002AB7B945|nr:Fanconi anemia core complex-associated protein 24-like isoform X2 [Lethenteron reissneri]XP_061432321.1 Fanconi anemia core complex-associated protein 24-like isoform X2 [Lethenteron reissneri]
MNESCVRGATPARPGTSVPPGHVLISEKWRGTQVAQALSGKVRLVFEEAMGLTDFQLSDRTCLLFITESDQVTGSDYKRRLVRFRKKSAANSLVLVELTPLSEQYFADVQAFVVLDLGMAIVPVAEEGKSPGTNPFSPSRGAPGSGDAAVLDCVTHIPGIGRVKALALLERFPSLHALSTASDEQLAVAVGRGAAASVRAFFTQRTGP